MVDRGFKVVRKDRANLPPVASLTIEERRVRWFQPMLEEAERATVDEVVQSLEKRT